MARIIRYCTIAAVILIIVLNFLGAADFIASPYTGIRHHNLKINKIDEPNRDSQLKSGDKIVEVNGVKVKNINHYKYLMSLNREYQPFTLTIERNDSLYTSTIEVRDQPKFEIMTRIGLMISGFTFLLVGLIVLLKRPDIMGMLFSVDCVLIAFLLTERPAVSYPFLHIAGELIYDLIFIFLPAVFLHFFLMFPGREIEHGTRRFKLERWMYLPPVFIYLASFVLSLANYSAKLSASVIYFHETITSIYWFSYMLLCPVIFIRTYLTSSRALKIKFRIVTIGLVAGLLPFISLVLLMQINQSYIFHHKSLTLAGMSLSFISISFGYAILKHNVFNIKLIFRGGADLALLVIIAALLYFLFKWFGGSGIMSALGMNNYLFYAAAIVVLAVIFIPARAYIFSMFDRYFHGRQAAVLSRKEYIEFSRDLRRCETEEIVLRRVTDEIVNIFNPENIIIFMMNDEGSYELGHIYPPDKHVPITSIASNRNIENLLYSNGYPLVLEYSDSLWISNNLDRVMRELIHSASSSAIIPVIKEHFVTGFILLGAKRSGNLYNSEDADLLNSIAEIAAEAVNNIKLYRSRREKEELERDIEITSTIQKNLLPDKPPLLRGAELGARIKPCKGVGGDFYDFIRLSPDVTVFVISDISGKGIPASFLMSTLQASIRAEAQSERAPSEVIYYLNNYLFERSDSIRHATMFYGKYNESNGILDYCNAGALPPILFRQGGRQITRLRRGGLLVGIEKGTEYLDGSVEIEPGDLLIAFTDGVTELQYDGEFFGIERLVEFVRSNIDMPVDEMLENLFQKLDLYCHGRITDDITAMALKKIQD